MIRFSAALVAVAIAVLIGGIAASELSLVYIAIVVSAVALVALATGVVLKREELFGEAQGLAPAGAGAGPVQSVRAGEGYDQDRSATPVTPPPLQGVVVGPGAAFGRTAQAASAQSAAPWETQTARGSWPPVKVDARPAWTAPAAQSERSGIGADSRATSVRQATAPSSGTQGGWGAPDASESPAATAAATAGAAAPWSWAAPSPSAFSPTAPETLPTPEAPPAPTGPGSGSTPPSWFDRRNESADVAATAPASGSSWSWSSTDGPAPAGTDLADGAPADDVRADDTDAPTVTAVPADATTAVDEDDDWPTRYSWLDDEPDENGAGSDDKPDENIEAVDSADHSSLDDHASPSPASAATLVDEPATLADEPATLAAEPAAAGTSDTETEAAAETEVGAATETEAAAEAESGESEPPAATTADPAPGAGLVSVIRGVPRYHDAECVLIRFMPEGDIQKLSIPQAKELGCTPCAACQPEG